MITLNNGVQIAQIGFGTWYLQDDNDVEIIKNAIKMGYRIIDTAQAYGNEEIVGKAINEAINEGIVKREELFISSKINPHNKIGYDEAIAAVNSSLKKMNLDYIDLYMIHWPNLVEDDSWKSLNRQAWCGFEKMVEMGKLKSIGVSNFMIHHLEELLKTAKIKPVINQLNLNPTWQQKEVVDFCKRNNIICQAWAPIVRVKQWNSIILNEVATKYQKSIPQICLKWCIQKGFTPLTKTRNVEHMKENLNIFDFEISNEDIKYLDSLNSHPWDHDSQPDCLYEIFRLREIISQRVTPIEEKFILLGFLPIYRKNINKQCNIYSLFNLFPVLKIKNINSHKTKYYLFNFIYIGKKYIKTKVTISKQLPTY